MSAVESSLREIGDLTDAEIFALTQNIKDEEASRNPLISPLEPLSTLKTEYEAGAQAFVRKIESLQQPPHSFAGIRRARGDGNCFYTSTAFAWISGMMNLTSENRKSVVESALLDLEKSLNSLKAVGFEPIVYEDFYEVLTDLIRNILYPVSTGTVLNPASLLQQFQNAETVNSIVIFLRLLISSYIRLHPDDFEPFLFNPDTGDMVDIKRFCEGWVEAVGREADHPQILALSRALKLPIHIAYLDRSGGDSGTGKVDLVEFDSVEGETSPILVTLLYRPGHYDILDKKAEEPAEFLVS
ncbi:hypothetical protein BOTBODRAFT_54008 [Botryobasidium botryosum FD-172 SS1]|uniref:ubiquitinyl hydrolase 1 n=1 Tax=Botryobasidium botryosum (strain FD-172 SS1) TaxID=930990 RepID=A0A067MLY4_BOTB1|nr:hypothetical protein BOTBODRAFT_54008 [Botryobasidium botryosum FD-172 SS1]